MLIASRAFSGVMSGNISAAFAYVADVTGPRERAKGLGMIGAAFNHGKNWAPLRQRLDGVFNYDRPDDQRQRRLFTRHRGNIRLAANANIALRAGRKPDALPTGIRLMDSVNDAIAAQTGDR